MCFQWVTSLEISDTAPLDEGGIGCTPGQYAHLGKCFPKLRTFTCYEGRRFDGASLPFAGVWPDLQEVIYKNVNHSEAEMEGSSLLGKAGRGPLIVTDLHKPPVPGRVGLPLKEVHFVHWMDDSSLMALANANLLSLETINLQLRNTCSLPLLLQLLSPQNCPLLRTLNLVVYTWTDDSDSEGPVEDKPALFTNPNLGTLFAQLPPLTSLRIGLEGPCTFSTLPLSSSLIESLRRLELDFGHDAGWPADIDLDPVLRCTALEELGLFGFAGMYHGQVTSTFGDCRSLHSLYVDLWEEGDEIYHEEGVVILESIAKAAPPTLTHLNLADSRVDPAPSGRRVFEVATAFWPFDQLLRKLDCKFFASTGLKYRFTGWDRLQHLSLESVEGLSSNSSQLVISCPSLRSFKIESDTYVNLSFEGNHEHLATLDICMENRFQDLSERAGVRCFVHLISESLGRLGALTDLTINAGFCSNFYVDPSVTKALAGIASLKVLTIKTPWDVFEDLLQASIFDEFLLSPSLRELHVSASLAELLLEFLKKFYNHETRGLSSV